MSDPKVPEPTDRSASPRRITAAVLVVLALVFIFQNAGTGRVTFLLWRVDAPAWTWLVLIFAVGMVVGSIFPWFRRRG